MERHINSLAGLSSTKKNNKQFMKLAETFNQSRLINEALVNSEVESYDIEKTANFSNAVPLKEKTKKKAKMNRKLCEQIKMDILSECFASVVFDSIMLDEDYKIENKERLMQNFSETFKGLAEAGCLEKVPAPLYEDYIQPAVSVFSEIDTNIEEPEKVIASIKGVEGDLDVSPEKVVITEAIREKVLDVIKEEKIFASKRNFLKETYGKKFDGSSLFNSMNMYNFMTAKTDMLTSNSNLTLTEFNKDEKLLEEVNEKALAETICDYTLLETLNTCGLLKENCRDLVTNTKKALNFSYKNEI